MAVYSSKQALGIGVVLALSLPTWEGPWSEIATSVTFAQEEQADKNAGLDDLDRAVQKKLTARTLRELEEAISLADQALEKGLDEGNTEFAQDLLAATLYERASGIAQRVFRGDLPGPQWATFRQYAISSLNRSLEYDDSNGDSHLLLSRLHALPGGDAEKARDALEKAMDRLADEKDKLSKAYVLKAAFAKEAKERFAALDRAIELDPRNTDAWRTRGAYHWQQQDADKAIKDFVKVLEIQPDNLTVLTTMAQVLFRQSKLEDAMKYISRAIELNRDSSAAYTLRAAIHSQMGELDAAITDLDRAVDILPSNLAAMMMRARLLQQQQKFDLALQDLNQVLRLAPQTTDAMLMRAMLHAANDDVPKAITDLETVIEKNPDASGLRLQLAALYYQDQRPRKAIEIYSSVVENDPANWRARRGRADANLSIGKHAEAIQDYEEALTAEPDDEGRSGILNNLAWVLATSTKDEIRDGKRSVELANKACEITDFKAAHILSTLAAAYAEAGDFETARSWSGRAVDKAKEDLKVENLDDAQREHLEEQLTQLEKELESYKQENPWRELVETKEKGGDAAPDGDDLDDRQDSNSAPTANDDASQGTTSRTE